MSLANIDKIRSDRRIAMEGEEMLAGGQVSCLPLLGPKVDALIEQTDIYRKERSLIYGCLMISGQLETVSGFSRQRSIHSPLLYFPARLTGDDEIYLEIDGEDLMVNAPLLRLIVKQDIESSVIDTFPMISWPLEENDIFKIGKWLELHTSLKDVLELTRWPSITDKSNECAQLRISVASHLLLADRSRGSRGILHELSLLQEVSSFSGSVSEVLGPASSSEKSSTSNPEVLPGFLSKPQANALSNSARHVLSLVSGPPGTGKSYTIAAIAIDRMLNGESVLVVAKTEQAVAVVGEKLREAFGLEAGFVCANDQSFLKFMKEHLDSLLKEGLAQIPSVKESRSRLSKAQKQLKSGEKAFARMLRAARFSGSDSSILMRLLSTIYTLGGSGESIWSSQSEVGRLQDQFEHCSLDHINAYRLESLSRLLQKNRKALIHFQQALKAQTSRRQEERFEKTDFDVVLKAFPIWLVPLDEVNRVLPFVRDMFDLVVIDESSQCDISSALPILQRAKRAVVVGDRKQLRHVSFLSRAAQEKLWVAARLSGQLPEHFGFRDQSIMDFVSNAISSQSAVTLLDEHYRSKPELIAFSNAEFYSNKLKVMQARPGVNNTCALQFIRVMGKRTPAGRNNVEKEAVLTHLRRHCEEHCELSVKPSIGILSPFREQAEFLQKEVIKYFDKAVLQDFKVRVSTPYGFQGEERDVMLLSMSIDNESVRASTYLNREDVFNVSVTRAKEKQIVFYSIDEERLSSENLFRRYLKHSVNSAPESDKDSGLCDTVSEMKSCLEEAGANVWVAYGIAGQDVDLVCKYGDKVIGVDLIGYSGEFEEYFSLHTYKTLYRAGLDVIPLPFNEWQKNREECMNVIEKRLGIKR
ncbi:DEAD/DEAH box helicase [Endozoicomonas arenosclerae]|uniref:DEAD/DEAH box helicase n=1 Tax=Endozoicomonas arenosclerae TaxID=1633495 RepID=UPI0007845EC9|nr:ATP-binding protein [Endozoicomonas arenosclerae]